jgi:hypothetical protein
MHEHGWIKWRFELERLKTSKVLKIKILADLLNGLLITGAKPFFNNQSP